MQVVDGSFTITLPVDTVVTLSTLSGQQKGSPAYIPPSSPFPVPYSDNFNGVLHTDVCMYVGVWTFVDSL